MFKTYECELKLRDAPGSSTCTGDASTYGSITDISENVLNMNTNVAYDKEFCIICKACYNKPVQSAFFKVKTTPCTSCDETEPNVFFGIDELAKNQNLAVKFNKLPSWNVENIAVSNQCCKDNVFGSGDGVRFEASGSDTS